MSKFEGTTKEFHRYIGPRIRNLVQSITKGYRRDLGKCEREGCTETEKLEAAHLHGRERPTLIVEALNGYIHDDRIKVDLLTFEERFKELHYPLHETIKILCSKCHREYDRKNTGRVKRELTIEKTKEEKQETKTLPITLIPEDKTLFKEIILQSKKAKFFIHYETGAVAEVDWDASNLSNQSNIYGNIRSRPDFRQGNWQRKKIKSVVVEALGLDVGNQNNSFKVHD